MKKTIITVLIIALSFSFKMIVAQGVTVTDNPSYSKEASAILDVMSTSRGLLPPRMTTVERDGIITPVEGLIIFNISSNTLDLYNGTSWGSLSGEFICGSSQVADEEGNLYSTVQIGSQCWMTKNLNTGIMLSSSIDQSSNATIEKYCYDNNAINCDVYGGLYQWNEMMQYITDDSTRGICPENWHIPSDAEWSALEQRLDPTVSSTGTGWRGTDAGTQLKQGGSSGFNGFLAGYRNIGGTFSNSGSGGYFWTSTESQSAAWERYVYGINATSGRSYPSKAFGLSVRCVYNENTSKLPVVITGQASNIGGATADVTGEISDLGIEGATVLHYGHCWSTSSDPTLSDAFSEFGPSDTVGTFMSNIDDLDELTTFYVRAYVENNEGLTYGAQINFTTVSGSACPGTPTVTYGGQVYNTVQVGSQCWMKENLNIGTMINGSVDQSDNATIEKYCYNNAADSCSIYGGLYMWNEMMQYSTTEGVQGICPSGWHLPTDDEWCTLENFVDAGTIVCSATGLRGIDVSDNLKESGTAHWPVGNTGTNTSDFTALPSGFRNWTGSFSNFSSGYFRSSTEYNASNSWTRSLYSSNPQINRNYQYKSYGQPVRCIKD